MTIYKMVNKTFACGKMILQSGCIMGYENAADIGRKNLIEDQHIWHINYHQEKLFYKVYPEI